MEVGRRVEGGGSLLFLAEEAERRGRGRKERERRTSHKKSNNPHTDRWGKTTCYSNVFFFECVLDGVFEGVGDTSFATRYSNMVFRHGIPTWYSNMVFQLFAI